MVNLTRLRIAFIGMLVFSLGIAISGVLRTDFSAGNSPARNFDSARGQIGFLLQAVEHRQIGAGLGMIGLALLLVAFLKSKWQ